MKINNKLFYLILAETFIMVLLAIWVFRGTDTLVLQASSPDTIQDISLPAGTYQAYIDYTSADSNNAVTFISDSNSSAFLADTLQLYPWRTSDYIQLWAFQDFHDISLAYSQVGDLTISNISIYATNDIRKIVWVAFLTLFVILDSVLLWFNYIFLPSSTKKGTFLRTLLLLGGVLLASWPLHIAKLEQANDLVFHLERLEATAEALAMGQFPVRITPYYFDGAGYASSIFYGDILLYFPSFFRIMGFPLQTSYKIFILGINLATAGVSWFSFSRITKHRWSAAVASFIYTLSLYRLGDIYIRAAVGEYTAMLFLPLVFCGMYFIFTRYSQKDRTNTSWIMLGTGMAGILICHCISSLIVVISLVLWCLFYLKRIWRERLFLPILKAALLAFGLSAVFLIPFADYMLSGSFNINSLIQGTESLIQDSGLPLLGFYNLTFSGSDMKTLGIFCLIWWLAYAIFLFVPAYRKKMANQVYHGITLVLYTTLLLWMTTMYFPWDFLVKHISLMNQLTTSIQFSFRFTAITTVLCTICACLVMDTMIDNMHMVLRRSLLVLFGIILCVCSFTAINSRVIHGNLFKIYDRAGLGLYIGYGTIQGYDVNEGFYLPTGTNQEIFKGLSYSVPSDGSLTVSNYSKYGITMTMHCVNSSETEQLLTVPFLYYKGYIARDALTGEKLETYSNDDNLVTICIPAGFDSDISVSFVEPWYWRAAELLTLACLISLLIYKFHPKRCLRSNDAIH